MSLRLTKIPKYRVRIWFTNKDRKNFIANEVVEKDDKIYLYSYKNDERVIIGDELKEECVMFCTTFHRNKIKKYTTRKIVENGEPAHVQVVHVH